MSFQSNVTTALIRIGTEFKALRTLIGGSGTATISALTTTDKSSLVAAINEVKAGSSGSPADATTTVKGIVELATDAETTTGTDTVRATTPSNIKAAIDARLDDNTALGASTTKAPTQHAAKAYIDTSVSGVVAAADAFVAKGGIDASTNPNYPAASAGDTYRITVAGKIGGASGIAVEVGDLITCFVDGTAAGNQATVGANWTVTQTNIDGAVVGPASSTSSDFATFSGTSGKVVQDSGLSLDVDTSLAANSDTKIPSQKAVKGYTYSQTQIGDPTHDFAADFTTALS